MTKNTLNLIYHALNSLRLPNGLYRASSQDFYSNYSWHRDNCNAVIDYLETDPEKYKQTYQTTLDLLKFFEIKYNKFSSFIKDPDLHTPYKFLHAKINIHTHDEEHDHDWSHLQFDNAAILYWIAKGEEKGIEIIRDQTDRDIIQLFIDFLVAWRVDITPNASYWEENCEHRSSSLGICLASFIEIQKIGFNVPQWIIDNCQNYLNRLLPRESINRHCDLALLSLIYPYNIVTPLQRDYILNNIETYLTREHGVIRYENDYYYNSEKDHNKYFGNEAQWVFGLFYLSNIYLDMNHLKKAKYYLEKGLSKAKADGSIPELIYSKTGLPNVNYNLAWADSMAILALRRYINKKNS